MLECVAGSLNRKLPLAGSSPASVGNQQANSPGVEPALSGAPAGLSLLSGSGMYHEILSIFRSLSWRGAQLDLCQRETKPPVHGRRNAIRDCPSATKSTEERAMFTRRMQLAAAIFAVALLSFAAGTIAQGRYPEINRAEGALRAALNDMQLARDVFGGHKRAAEGLVNQAIGELEAGKAFAASRGN